MIELVIWILFGVLAGWIASLVMRTDTQQGMLDYIAIGVLGALLGGYMTFSLSGPPLTGFDLTSMMVAFFSAAFLIGLFTLVRHSQRS